MPINIANHMIGSEAGPMHIVQGLVHARVNFFLRSDHVFKEITALQVGVRIGFAPNKYGVK